MAGFGIATLAATAKDALYSAAVQLWADTDVQVTFGHPGQYMADDLVALTRVSTTQEPATLGTNRGRDELIEIDVQISIARGGGPEMEKVASDRAYELLGQLERHVRVTDTTLGGVVRECFVLSTESTGTTNPKILAEGRLIEILATFGAKARVRG